MQHISGQFHLFVVVVVTCVHTRPVVLVEHGVGSVVQEATWTRPCSTDRLGSIRGAAVVPCARRARGPTPSVRRCVRVA
eukprot:4651219-Lingulodinium_polyedra.AAC.2